jgi:hypothetical protein
MKATAISRIDQPYTHRTTIYAPNNHIRTEQPYTHRTTIYAPNLHDKLLALKSNETTCNEMIAGFTNKARKAIEHQEGVIVDLLELAEKQNRLLKESLGVIGVLCFMSVFAGICAVGAKVITRSARAQQNREA